MMIKTAGNLDLSETTRKTPSSIPIPIPAGKFVEFQAVSCTIFFISTLAK
jgi:hypothetical protein